QRRRLARARGWGERHGVPLDESLAHIARARSAFRGRPRKGNAPLARFLADVEADRVPRDAALLVENLDRLSRENPWQAVPLLCGIVNAGVAVVVLSPSEMIYDRDANLTTLLMAVLEFGQGHSESASKADRVSSAWDQKKRRAREEGAIVTHHLPAWVEDRGGKLVLNRARAKIVRQIFD